MCVYVCVCTCAQTLSHVQLFATPWTVAHQAPLSMGFPRQEYWSAQESSPIPQFKSINSLTLRFLYGCKLSHPHMTTGKTIALIIWIFVSKVMSLLFNMLSKFVTTFLPRSKGHSSFWLQAQSSVILEPKKMFS